VRLFLAAACARRNGRVLLARRRSTFLDGLWEFPSAEANTRSAAREKLRSKAKSLHLRLDHSPIGAARHSVVNRRILVEVFEASPDPKSENQDPGAMRWFTTDQLRTAAIPTLTRKIARAAAFL
jgi:adenine-specific DNA glycosylase